MINKNDADILKNVMYDVLLEKTKGEILSELALTVKFVDSNTSKEVAEQIKSRIQDISNELQQLYYEILVSVCMGEINTEIASLLRQNDAVYWQEQQRHQKKE